MNLSITTRENIYESRSENICLGRTLKFDCMNEIQMYFTENEWQMCWPGWVEGSTVWSVHVPLLFACNHFFFVAHDEDFMCCWPEVAGRIVPLDDES